MKDAAPSTTAKILALGISFLVSILAAEGMLRIFGVGRPVFHRPDATFGLALIPGSKGLYVNEGRAYISINADGFRDVDHARTKPPGTLRIAVLGDSFAEALQVPLTQTFWSQMERALGSCANLGGKRIEVLNFGVSGFGTAQEYLLLQRRVWSYQPDIVLLAVLTGNDVSDNHPELGAVQRPFFRFEREQLVLDTSGAVSLTATGRAALWLIGHSRVLQLVNQVRLNHKACGTLTGCGQDLDIAHGEAGLRNQLYLEPNTDAWRDAWRVTEALIGRIRDEVTAHHARLLLATLSNSIQVHPDAEVRERFRGEVGAADLGYPDRRFVEIADRVGVPILTLAPALLREAESRRTSLHGFEGPNLGKGHWNEAGHTVAAKTLSPWVCQNLAQAPPRPKTTSTPAGA